MNEKFDFHCHSTISDGDLSPVELVQRAHEQGVTCLALTDHDSVAGVMEAQQTAKALNMGFVPGIEFSASWNNLCVHIIGLNIDPASNKLLEGTRELQTIRIERAIKISRKLEKKKIHGAYTTASALAGAGMITRTHFAHFLLQQCYVSNLQEAFDLYLGDGKSAHVATQWVELETVIDWINQAGGVAVLAHPMRYKLTASKMHRLLSTFRDSGGAAMEVVSGRNNPDDIHRSASHARRFDLAGSIGSDFHSPKNPWIELGRLPPLPDSVTPVWKLFN